MWQGFFQLVTGPRADRNPPLDDGHGYYVLVQSQGGDPVSDSSRFEAVLTEALEQGMVIDAVVAAPGADDPETRHQVEQAVYEPLAAIGGSISGEHGIGLEKKPWLHLSRSAAEIDTLRRLKQALDPKGILNPGKVV